MYYTESMNFEDLQKKIVAYRDERNWKQFHNPKDLAISLSLEASELLEHFQWKNPEEVTTHLRDKKGEVSDELADVLYWVLLMSHELEIDILSASYKKLEINKAKYPVDKAKNNHKKYTDL
jgi:dCTP diphosphatase